MKTASRRRIVVWGVVGVIVLALLIVALMPRPVAVDLVAVTRGPMMVTLDHEGKTRVHDRFVVSAPTTGRVLRIELEPGDRVQAGRTVLATFQPAVPPLLDARTRAEAQSRVKAAAAALERARAAREQARVESAHAAAEAARARRLQREGVVSEQEATLAETEARVRARALEQADAAVDAATHDLEAANAALIEPAPRQAGQASGPALVLRAPIDGVVLRRLHESEATVVAGEPLIEVADPGALEMVADYLSADAVRIKPGMRVVVEQWGGGRALDGRVRRVEPAGFMKISALGVEEQRVWVVMDFADPRDAWAALGDGYRVEARVVVWEAADVVQVPASSLFRQGEGWAAFVVQDGRARVRQVEIGQRNGATAEVRSGLRAGEQVVVHPPDSVADGMRVSPRA
jgi:HlyD family secretion protein